TAVAQQDRSVKVLNCNILKLLACSHHQIAAKIGYLIACIGHASVGSLHNVICCSLDSNVIDPYSREEQAEFAKCDSMCGGPEHAATASHSFCTQNIFHAPLPLGTVPDNALGYVSHDGHSFDCKDPALLRQSFHVYVFRMISEDMH
ncbi:hypothetical protein HETIRDRAFT_329644, partial [Heterobasidion irregulare TC 32-1]